MAFNLPLFSKEKHAVAAEGTGMVSGLPSDDNSSADAAKSAADRLAIHDSTLNPNATYIGDVLQKSGDIRLPLIGYLPLQKQVRVLLIMLASALVLGAAFVWLNSDYNALTSMQTQIAGDALMHSQRVGKATPNAIQGNPVAFTQLADSRREFNNDLSILMNGGTYQGQRISKPGASMASSLQKTQKLWQNSDKSAATILKLQKELTGFGATLTKMNAISPDLLELTEQISTLKAQGGASSREIAAAGQLVMLTQRLARSANEFLSSEGVNPETAFLLGKDTNTFRDITEGFLNGNETLRLSKTTEPETREKLVDLQNLFGEYQKSISLILGNLQNFIAAKQAEETIFKEN